MNSVHVGIVSVLVSVSNDEMLVRVVASDVIVRREKFLSRDRVSKTSEHRARCLLDSILSASRDVRSRRENEWDSVPSRQEAAVRSAQNQS